MKNMFRKIALWLVLALVGVLRVQAALYECNTELEFYNTGAIVCSGDVVRLNCDLTSLAKKWHCFPLADQNYEPGKCNYPTNSWDDSRLLNTNAVYETETPGQLTLDLNGHVVSGSLLLFLRYCHIDLLNGTVDTPDTEPNGYGNLLKMRNVTITGTCWGGWSNIELHDCAVKGALQRENGTIKIFSGLCSSAYVSFADANSLTAPNTGSDRADYSFVVYEAQSVARVGLQFFTTLQDAVDAVPEGGEIQLLQDRVETVVAPDHPFTLCCHEPFKGSIKPAAGYECEVLPSDGISLSYHRKEKVVRTLAEFEAALAGQDDSLRLGATIIVTNTISVSRDLVIDGRGYTLTVPTPGANEFGVYQEGGSAFPLIDNSGGHYLVVSNLILRGGSKRCVYNSPTNALKMVNCTIERGGSTSENAMALRNEGRCHLINCRLTHHVSNWAGAVCNAGTNATLVLENCSLDNNRTTGGGAGAIENREGGTLIASSTTFCRNMMSVRSKSASSAGGSAIKNDSTNSTTYLLCCTVAGNISTNHTENSAGCYVQNGKLHAVSSLFYNNYYSPSSISTSSAYDIHAADASNVTLSNCAYGVKLSGISATASYQYSTSLRLQQVFVSYHKTRALLYDGTRTAATYPLPIDVPCASGTDMVQPAPRDGNKDSAWNIGLNLGGTEVYLEVPDDTRLLAAETVKASFSTSYTPIGSLTPTTDASRQILTYQDGSPRSAGTIGAVAETSSKYVTLVLNQSYNGTAVGASEYGDYYPQGMTVNLTATANKSYAFQKWKVVANSATNYPASNPLVLSLQANTTVTPVFAWGHTLSYDTLGIGTAPDAQFVSSWSTTSKPKSDLSADGYTFGGWYASPACHNADAWEFGKTLSDDQVLYAKWTVTASGRPPAPVATRATECAAGTFKANWETSSRAATYKVSVHRKADCSDEPVRTVSGLTQAGSVVTDLAEAGYEFYYRVRAIDENGEASEWSNIIVVTIPHAHGSVEFSVCVQTADELKALFENGGTAYLGSDIALDEAIEAASGNSVELCLFGHVIDLQGNNVAVPSGKVRVCNCDRQCVHGFDDSETVNGLWVPAAEASAAAHCVTGGVVTGGSAAQGGAFGVTGTGRLELSDVCIAGNVATAAGGGVYATDDGLALGGNALIQGNAAQGAVNNLCFAKAASVELLASEPLTTKALVGIVPTEPVWSVQVTGANSTDCTGCFWSDASRYVVSNGTDNAVWLTRRTVVVQPTGIDHVTVEVYTNGIRVAETESGKWTVLSGDPTTVVYSVVPDYFFEGGMTAVTNAVDTTTDPATLPAPPAAPTQGPLMVTKNEAVSYHYFPSAAFASIGNDGTGTVTVLRNVAYVQKGAASVPNGSDITLDLAGQRIDWTTTEGDALIYFPENANGKLTITDSSIGGTISSVCTSEDKEASSLIVFSAGDGSLTVDGGVFASTNLTGGATMFFKNGNGDWTFNGGTYLARSEGEVGATFLYCGGATGTTVVSGGTYDLTATTGGGHGIGASELCREQVTVAGGDFDISSSGTWYSAFTAGNGSLLVTGGTFDVTTSGTGVACIGAELGGSVILSNGTFSIVSSAGYAYAASATDTASLEIAGGTYSAKGETDTIATVIGKMGSKLTIVDKPVIQKGVGGWAMNIELFGATFDFSRYAGDKLSNLVVFADDTYGPSWVTADMAKFNGASIWAGYFSTRPHDWTVMEYKLPLVNLDPSTKDAYPWVIGKGVAEGASGSGNYYATVSNALEMVQDGESVRLLTNANENVTLAAGTTRTLDLDGHVLTGTMTAIAIPSDAALTLKSGTVASAGTAVDVGGSLTVGGSLVIAESATNVFLAAGKTLAISTEVPLAPGTRIGVTTAVRPTEDAPVQITSNGTAADVKFFTSDDPLCFVTYNANGYLELAVTMAANVDKEKVYATVEEMVADSDPGDGVVIVSEPNDPVIVDRPLIIATAVDDVTEKIAADEGKGLVKSEPSASPDGTILVVVGAPTNGTVLVERDSVVVEKAERPESANADLWTKATNALATASTANATAIIPADLVKDATDAAKGRAGSVAVIAEVNVEVTPVDVKDNGYPGSAMELTEIDMDITPTISFFSVEDGTTTNALGEAKELHEVPGGKSVAVSFDLSAVDKAPTYFLHYRTDGRIECFYDRNDATVPAGAKRFDYDAGTRVLTVGMTSFSLAKAGFDANKPIQVGDDAWALITDGLCTVFGTGDMWSYAKAGTSALWGYQGLFSSVVIGDRVTGVGTNFFAYMKGVKEVRIDDCVKNVAAKAFYHCTYVTNLVVGAGVNTVGDFAFERNYSLTTASFGSPDVAAACQNAYKITARITMDGETPVVDAVPEVRIEGWKKELQGKTNLTDAVWIPLDDKTPIPYGFHFFKYEYVKEN